MPRKSYPNLRERNGRIRVRWQDDSGRDREKVTLAANRKEAAEMQRELARKAERVRLGLDKGAAEPIAWEVFARDVYLPMASSLRSFETVKGQVARIVAEFGQLHVHATTTADINRLIHKMRQSVRVIDGEEREYAPATVEHIRRRVRKMLSVAIDLGLRPGPNPATKAEKSAIPESAPRVIDLELIPRILAAVREVDRGLVATAIHTGMRGGELLGLRVESVHLDERVIIVERSHGKATKTNRFRTVAISEELAPFLRVELARSRSAYLFPGPRGGRRSRHTKLALLLRRALVEANIVDGYDLLCRRKGCGFVERRADDAVSPCPRCGFLLWAKSIPRHILFKDFRSTFATHAYESTGDARFVQKTLGHASAKTTEFYTRTRDEHLLRQTNRVTFGVTTRGEGEMEMESGRQRASGGMAGGIPPTTLGKITSDAVVISEARPAGIEPAAFGFEVGSARLGPSSTESHPAGSSSFSSRDSFHPVAPSRPVSLPLSGGRRAKSRRGLKLGASGDGLLTIQEVAKRLGVHVDTVRKLCKAGKLRCERHRNREYVRPEDLAAYLRQNNGGGAK